jgi:hypothetical protein
MERPTQCRSETNSDCSRMASAADGNQALRYGQPVDIDGAMAFCDDLGEIFCLTLIKGVDDVEALHRMGAYPDTLALRTGEELSELVADFETGYPKMVAALTIGDWAVVIQPDGFEAADGLFLERVSVGTEVLAVLRHDYARPQVAYAVDGTTMLSFDPSYPDVDLMHGADVGAMLPLLRELGLRDPAHAEDEDDWRTSVANAMLLAQRVTGVQIRPMPLHLPRLSAQFEPWFVRPPYELLQGVPYVPGSVELAAAAEAADPGTQRTVAVAEMRRLATALGIDGTPGLSAVLDAAAQGTAAPITADSPLGTYIRAWLTASQRAGYSLNDPPYRNELTDDERDLANGYEWFVTALGAVLDPDPRTAVLAALCPLGSDIYGGPDVRAAVIDALQTDLQN